MLYATHKDGSKCEIQVSYNHSTSASFTTKLITVDGKIQQFYGHPKKVGITKKEGWKIEPEMNGPW